MRTYSMCFFAYLLGVLTISACAAVEYKYYTVALPDQCYQQGTMLGKLGKNGWSDLPFSECRPDAAVAGKCILQLEQDFYNKDRALKECQSDLIACQKAAISKS